MQVSEFDYNLPQELIAQTPLAQRDSSRLLLLDRRTGEVQHSIFYAILDELQAGDMLVVNDTKVLPARLFAHKESGALIELLLLRELIDEELASRENQGISMETYVLNMNTRKFHSPSCESVPKIKENNKKEFIGSREDLISTGYSPCGNCHP